MTQTTTKRPPLHAYVTTEAHARWHDFSDARGCSVSALLEAMAFELDLDAAEAERPMRERLGAVVQRARKVDADNRKRKRS